MNIVKIGLTSVVIFVSTEKRVNNGQHLTFLVLHVKVAQLVTSYHIFLVLLHFPFLWWFNNAFASPACSPEPSLFQEPMLLVFPLDWNSCLRTPQVRLFRDHISSAYWLNLNFIIQTVLKPKIKKKDLKLIHWFFRLFIAFIKVVNCSYLLHDLIA